MQLTPHQVESYRRDGYLLLPGLFSAAEVETLRGELPRLLGEDTPGRVLEKQTGMVRSVYASHTRSEVMARLARHPRLLGPARQIVGTDVYVHQFKINAKAAFGGEVWEWHQDYVFWLMEDGMPAPRVTNVMVFLDEVNEFNGPLLLIPGSHREGVVDSDPRVAAGTGEPAWMANVGAELKYSLSQATVAALVHRSGIVAPKGKAGSVLFFDANIFHGSAPNMSPFGRTIVIATYNSVENQPVPPGEPRPEFLAARDYAALVPVDDGALLV